MSEVEQSRKARLVIDNPAPNLTEERYAALTESAVSSKPEGLSLGLSIVRGIVDSHAGTLAFYRMRGFLRALMTIPGQSGER